MKKYIITILVLVVVGIFVWQQRITIKDNFSSEIDLPEPVTFEQVEKREALPDKNLDIVKENQPDEVIPEKEIVIEDPSDELPTAINLKVPFQAQAPFGNWVEPYKEACEEASLIMVDHYLAGSTLSNQQMQDEIDAQVSWQVKNYGDHFDLTIAETATLAQAMYNYQTRIITDLTIDKIKDELRAGNPVIVPAAGRELGNPYFTAPGPLYHMLVIKGFINNNFITNDPGTKRGADYLYNQDTLLAAVADWDGDSPDGSKRGLVIIP